MKMPSKVIPYKESTVAKFPAILDLLEKSDLSPSELYKKVKRSKVKSISEFVEVLDCLYAMSKIELKEGGAPLCWLKSSATNSSHMASREKPYAFTTG